MSEKLTSAFAIAIIIIEFVGVLGLLFNYEKFTFYIWDKL